MDVIMTTLPGVPCFCICSIGICAAKKEPMLCPVMSARTS
jgi:hypothetical protein